MGKELALSTRWQYTKAHISLHHFRNAHRVHLSSAHAPKRVESIPVTPSRPTLRSSPLHQTLAALQTAFLIPLNRKAFCGPGQLRPRTVTTTVCVSRGNVKQSGQMPLFYWTNMCPFPHTSMRVFITLMYH